MVEDIKILIKEKCGKHHLCFIFDVEIFNINPEILNFNMKIIERKQVYILTEDAKIILPFTFEERVYKGFFHGDFSSEQIDPNHMIHKTKFYVDFDSEVEKIKFKLSL